MSQESIYQELKKAYPSGLTARELVERTGLARTSVSRCLKRLRHFEDICWEPDNTSRKFQHIYFYKK